MLRTRSSNRVRSGAARLAPLPLWALLAGAAGCSEPSPAGGLTARIEFGTTEAPDRASVSPTGVEQRALRSLRTAAVPEFVDRLQILALDVDGSTLAQTNLYAEPNEAQLRLFREGGTWTLDAVPAGTNRRLAGRAYFGPNSDPRLNGALVYTGQIDGVTVIAGQTTDAGVLVLRPGPDRIPEADFEPPPPPRALQVDAQPAGEALDVSWQPPNAEDVAGYIVATSSVSTGPRPAIERGTALVVGDAIDPAFRVVARLEGAAATTATIEGLTNGVLFEVLVYAFDDDATGAPLNFGAPSTAFGTAADTAPPAAPGQLTVSVSQPQVATIAFVAPGEDGPTDLTGRPAQYEIRTGPARGALEDPTTFVDQAGVVAPAPSPPGATITVERSFDALGVTPPDLRYVAVRAVDASGNAGPIAIAVLDPNDTAPPIISRLTPPIAFAGRELQIRGARFGAAPGTVTLTGTESANETVSLEVRAWTDQQILAQLPPAATTGRLTVTRADNRSVPARLAIIERQENVPDAVPPPFGFIAHGQTSQVAALYRDRGSSTVESATERIVDLSTSEGIAWAAVFLPQPAARVATSKNRSRFVFAAAYPDGRLDITLVNSSTTVLADPFRQTTSLGTQPPDALSLAARPSADDRAPVLVAFTLQGNLRIGAIADARFAPPNQFALVSSTDAEFDAVAVAVADTGAGLVAHRTTTATGAALSVRRSATAEPDSFELVPGDGPRAGPRVLVRAVPNDSGSFVIAYEQDDDDDGRIRVFDADRFPGPGLAAFGTGGGAGDDLRLEDLGWVEHDGDLYLAVAAVSGDDDDVSRLHYTEIPWSALAGPDPGDAVTEDRWPGVQLDAVSDLARPRLGCALRPAMRCPIAWIGDGQGGPIHPPVIDSILATNGFVSIGCLRALEALPSDGIQEVPQSYGSEQHRIRGR